MGAHWIADADFDIDRHVVPVTLQHRKGQGERAALQALCGELATTALDPAHPLWQFHLIENYEGGSAVILRIHHCIGDGIALISVMMSITDGGSDPPQRRRGEEHGEEHSHEGDWLADAVLKPLTDLTVKAIGMYGSGISKSMDMLSNPQGNAVEMAKTGYQVLHDAAALALMADDSPTALKGKPVGRKVVAWSEPMPLDAVKIVGKALNCSINDVLLACVAGAIGDYLQQLGEDPAGKEIRAMVPVNTLAPTGQGLAAGQPLRPGAAGAAGWASPTRSNASTRCAGAWAN